MAEDILKEKQAPYQEWRHVYLYQRRAAFSSSVRQADSPIGTGEIVVTVAR